MLEIKVDPHVHTIFSGHAYSTIEENAIHARNNGMDAIGIADHFSSLYSHPADMTRMFRDFGHMLNMEALPKIIHDVRILSSAEVDIVDFEGNLEGYDIEVTDGSGSNVAESLLSRLDYTIASVHWFEGYREGTASQKTDMYINTVLRNDVDILGHIARDRTSLDFDAIIEAAKTKKTLIEINEHSLDFIGEIEENCKRLALACAKHSMPIVIASDAHSSFFVGKFDKAIKMLEEIDFPKELVINTSLDNFTSYIESRKVL